MSTRPSRTHRAAIAQPSAHLPPDPAFLTQARLDFAAESDPSSLEARFRRWLAAHGDVYAAFRAEAMRLHDRGVAHAGAKEIVERLRYRTLVDGRDASEPYKLNNNYTSRLARLLVAEDPARFGHGFLRFRTLKAA